MTAACAGCGTVAPLDPGGLCAGCAVRARRDADSRGRQGGREVVLQPYSGIALESVEWLPGMEGRVPLGMLTLLVGEPGLGKSTLTLALAAAVSRRGRRAVLASAEDSPGVTVKPRLMAAGAEQERVANLLLRANGADAGLVIPDDLDALGRAIADGGAELLVIDPLGAHLPATVNSLIDTSVRAALAPLARLAQDHRTAVVVVAHLNKGNHANALHRIGGSVGIPAAARSALFFIRDPDDPDGPEGSRRVLVHGKCNIGPHRPSLRYEIEAASADGEPTSRLRLLGECDLTLSEALPRDDDPTPSERDEAREFLLAELGDGARPATEVLAEGKGNGIAERTLRRAKKALDIESFKEHSRDGAWCWRLPQSKAANPLPTHPEPGDGGSLQNSPSQREIPALNSSRRVEGCHSLDSGSLRRTGALGGHVLRALAAGPATAEQLARRLGLDARNGSVARGLEALEAQGLARRDGPRWRAAGAAAPENRAGMSPIGDTTPTNGPT